MPAQPPFLTPTRTPAIGRSALPRMSLMRVAAASVSRITWGRGRGLAIFLLSPLAGVKARQTKHLCHKHNNELLPGKTGSSSPHVEHDPRLVRHPAPLPGRGPHDVHPDRPDARDACDLALGHDRQVLRPPAAW